MNGTTTGTYDVTWAHACPACGAPAVPLDEVRAASLMPLVREHMQMPELEGYECLKCGAFVAVLPKKGDDHVER